MGAASSGGWLFSDSTAQVTLVLNDARCISLLPGEDLTALVRVGKDDPGSTRLTKDSPACLPVGPHTVLFVEFQAVVEGLQATARCLGEIVLPLEHIAIQCEGSLYQLWLPLEPSSSGAPKDISEHIQRFDLALRLATKEPRKPMVCLSLNRSSEKASRTMGLLQSHIQHSRMLQALYRHVRNSAAVAQSSQQLPHVNDGLVDSWATSDKSRRLDAFPDLPGPCEVPSKQAERDVGAHESVENRIDALREEIKNTSADANGRINQAMEAVNMLNQRISDKQVELIQTKKEVSRLWHDAEGLELENEKMELQLQRPSSFRSSRMHAEEAETLRQEVSDLAQQKQALALILKDFYGAMGKEPPPLSTVVSKHQGSLTPNTGGYATVDVPAPVPKEQSPYEAQGWTNMLPRPSELLASGSLEERSSLM